MNVQTQALLLTAFISLIFSLLVWTRKERSRTTLPFTLCNVFLFLHAASYVGLKVTGQSFFLRAYVAAAFFMTPAYLFLVYSYLFRQNRIVEVVLVALFGVAAAFSVTAFVPSVDSVMHFLSLFPPLERGPRLAAAVVLIALPTLSLILIRLLREKESLLKSRYLGLFLAATVTTAVIAANEALGGGPVGPIALVLFHYYLYQALVRFHSFRPARFLGRLVLLLFSAVFLAIVYGLFFFLVRPVPILFLFHTVAAAFILLIIYEPFLSGLESRAREYLLRGRGDAGRRIDLLVSQLSEQLTLDQIGGFMAGRVPDALGLSGAAVYLLEESGGMDLLAASVSAPDRLDPEMTGAVVSLVREPVALERLVQLASEGYPGLERDRYLGLIQFLRDCNGRWLVPLKHRREWIGLYVPCQTGASDTGENAAVILDVLADQAAVRIENARIFQKLRSQDRLATLGEMAASLAHEIRNPLGSMKGAAQYLLDEDLPEGSKEFVSIILDEADRLNGVLTRFLDYARPFELKREFVDINEIIQATLDFLADGEKPKGVRFLADLDEQVGKRYLDGEQIRQVFINLIKNAWQTQSDGGEVLVKTRLAAKKIFIEVADRGPGISPAHREKLFMPFFSTKKDGSGLGLTVSSRIVQAHSGRIFSEPRPGGGSRFIVELPADAGPDGKGEGGETDHPRR